ncbi:MAG: hypothetical protein ACOZBH_04500 [Patescibacteria group bacterium]
MTQDNVFERIRNYENDFLNKKAKIVGGYYFDQLETIKRIHLYYASQFDNGNSDEFGYKYFYNESKPRCKNATKNIDFDTKDIQIKAVNGGLDYHKAMIMRTDVRRWMRQRQLGKVINESVIKVPRYGTFVLKKSNSKKIVEPVDLRNIKCDTTANSLQDTWVVEDHYYTTSELRKMKDIWNSEAIELAIKSFITHRKENYDDGEISESGEKGNAQYILVKEFYDDVPENWVVDNGDNEKQVLAQFVVIMPEDSEKKGSQNDNKKQGLTLFKEVLEDGKKDYKEVHYDRIDGRWLGCGIVEDSFDGQMMKNEYINQIMLSIRLSNLILFQTEDKTLAKNILSDLMNGDILKVKGIINRIDTTNRGTQENTILNSEIENLLNKLSNSFEVTTGESMPSGTPLGLGQMLNQNANKLFDFIREEIGMFWQEVFEDWIMPEIEKDLNKEHILEILDKDQIILLNEAVKKDKVWEAIKKRILQGRGTPTQEDIQNAMQIIDDQFATKDTIYLDLPKDFYNFKKSVECYITDERYNKMERSQTLMTILQTVGGNPQLLDHPIFKQLLDWAQVAPFNMPKQGAPEPNVNNAPMPAPAMNK